MKNYIISLLVLPSLFIISCSKTNNPISTNEYHNPIHNSSISSMEIGFIDTCSYNFVVSFLSDFDSLKINETFLGGYLYVYADSGEYLYWANYFNNHSSINYITISKSNPDSLTMKFSLSGQISLEVEKQIISRNKHLHIIKFEEQPKVSICDFS